MCVGTYLTLLCDKPHTFGFNFLGGVSCPYGSSLPLLIGWKISLQRKVVYTPLKLCAIDIPDLPILGLSGWSGRCSFSSPNWDSPHQAYVSFQQNISCACWHPSCGSQKETGAFPHLAPYTQVSHPQAESVRDIRINIACLYTTSSTFNNQQYGNFRKEIS